MPSTKPDLANGVTARILPPDELSKLPNQPDLVDPDSKPADYTAMDEEELAQAEPDIINSIWDADQRSKRHVGRIDVPRLQVEQYEYVNGAWRLIRHGAAAHKHWAGDEGWQAIDEGACREKPGSPLIGPYNYRVKGLMPEAFERADQKASRRIVNNAGMQTGTKRDGQLYNAMIIWLATVPEDRTKPGGWDDQRMIDKIQVANGVEVVQELLLMGEVLQAISVILHLSQFTQQTEEILGNSSG